mmetsp:Transcript_1346/g.3903  ORF Transcript_1346/g.3903 Transcript_1346/m.3903 type:complete len:212 (+) Transcript_1346:7788-8423(+)
MVLGRQLLGAQPEACHRLHCQEFGIPESEGVQNNLADERVVWDHHGARPEQCLQVVRQLGTARISRIHGDVDSASGNQLQLGPLEHEIILPRPDRPRDGGHLLRDHRQDLEVDAVELVEAAPRARRRESLEKLAHRQIVEAIGAIEHDALHRQRLGQVLRRLRLARASRPLRRAPIKQGERPHQGPVAAIRQRRNHEAVAVSEVFEAIQQR